MELGKVLNLGDKLVNIGYYWFLQLIRLVVEINTLLAL